MDRVFNNPARGTLPAGGAVEDSGFTLMELMLVLAIVGILALVSIEALGDTMRAAREGATKGNLASIRAAIAVFVNYNDGSFPTDDLHSILNSGYINEIPAAYSYWHPDSSQVTIAALSTKEGGWRYDAADTSATWGMVWVNCKHTDRRGTNWSVF